jgi:hypothetical protein
MTYYMLNSYCTPKPYVVVDNVKPIKDGLNITWKKQDKISTNSPEVFGPAMWFTLHTGAAYLPSVLSPISLSRIKASIDGIPEIVPCIPCSEHARAFIEFNRNKINNMKTGDDVFKFYVDFHNYVNEKLKKPLMNYEDAYKLYKGSDVNVMKY